MYQIIERLGRAGGPKERQAAVRDWNRKYGEGNWEVVYQYDGKTYTRDEALEKFYNRSYLEFLRANPDIVAELCSCACEMYNPHADATGGVDLQCPAVMKALETLGLRLGGSERVAIGTFGTRQGQVYPEISRRLSPFNVPLWCDNKVSVERFWQEFKFLAVKQ